jgi:hypothetical protein
MQTKQDKHFLDDCRRRLTDALDPEVHSETVRHGRTRSTLRGTDSERLRLKAWLLEMRHRGLRDSRTEIR